MIDEHHEELASLYALDLLEGTERGQFEAMLEGDAALRSLVKELREASTALAHVSTVTPPEGLKLRVLASAVDRNRTQPTSTSKIIPFPTIIGWAAAACFAFMAAWFAQRYSAGETELSALRTQETLADMALKSASNQLEAERIIAQQQVSELSTQLAGAQQSLSDSARTAANTAQQLADALAAARDQQRSAADLTERLTAATSEIASLNQQMQTQGNLAELKIATLASMLNNSPQALAVAVWNPAKQEGVLTIEKLPPPAADQSYELWVIESKAGAKPVSAGVFATSANDSVRLQFRPVAPVSTLATFAVSREKKDGAASHAAPTEVVMMSH